MSDESTAEKSDKNADQSARPAARASTIEVRGIVIDEAESPVAGALVESVLGRESRKVRAGNDGRFVLTMERTAWPNSMLMARDEKSGRLAFFSNIDAQLRDPPPLTLVVKPPRDVEVLVQDSRRVPVAGAHLGVVAWHLLVGEAMTGDDGRALAKVPADAPLQYVYARKPGVGLDYFVYRQRNAPPDDPYKLPPDHADRITLTMTETRSVRVRVIDERQQPVSGALVYHVYFEIPRKGEIFNISGIREFGGVTDEAGIAVIDTIPVDNTGKITIRAHKKGYFAPKRWEYDVQNPVDELTAELLPLVPVRGKVTFADGRPAGGAAVRAGGAGYQIDNFVGSVDCDAKGEFEFRVYPDQYCGFVANRGRDASAVVHRVVRTGRPVEPVHLVLQPAARVYGTVTTGAQRRPMKQQYVILSLQDAGESYNQLPEEQRLPNPNDDRRVIIAHLSQNTATDDEGRFELFAGPGRYYIYPIGDAQPPPFVIDVGEEHEVNLHSERPERTEVAGRVVMKTNPERGVADVKLFGLSSGARGGFLQAATNAEGRFRALRSPVRMLIYARSSDAMFSGFAEIDEEDASFVLPIRPTGSAHGRLVDARSGQPLVDREIDFDPWVPPNGHLTSPFIQSKAITNELGEFSVDGLALDWKYELHVVIDLSPDGRPHRFQDAGNVTLTQAASVELGDLKVPDLNNPVQLVDRIERAMKQDLPPEQRLKTKLRDARLAEQRVLLLLAPAASDACWQFFKLYYGRDEEELPQKVRSVLANYSLLAIDTTAGPPLDAARNLLARYQIEPPGEDDAAFLILDSKGQLIAKATADDLSKDDAVNVVLLVKFLQKHAPPVPDAEKLFAEALAQAKRENKRVLVQQSGAFCAPCVLLSRFFDRNAALITKDYVYLKLDARFMHGTEVIARIRGAEEGGIPWMVILDAAGKPLVTSTGPDGNIGYPSDAAGIAHFAEMLRKTARTLTEADVDSLAKALSGE